MLIDKIKKRLKLATYNLNEDFCEMKETLDFFIVKV